MRLHHNSSLPDGELSARMNGCDDGDLFGVIDLGSSTLNLDTPEDARRLLEAAARIVGWFEFDGRPHKYLPLATSTHCAVCGLLKSRHAAPVITDSEPACESCHYPRSEPGHDEMCAQRTAYLAHSGAAEPEPAPDDDESGEDATVSVAESSEAERANPPHHALPGERACTIPGYEDKDGWVCTAQDGHDGPDHIAYRLGGGEYHRWPVTAVSSDEPASVTA